MIWWILLSVATLIVGFAIGVTVVRCWANVANEKLATAQESAKRLGDARRSAVVRLQAVTTERDEAERKLAAIVSAVDEARGDGCGDL